MNDEEICRKFYRAIQRADLQLVKQMFDQCPIVRTNNLMGRQNEHAWVDVAVDTGRLDILKLLLKLGYDINSIRLPENQTALISSIDKDHVELFDYLLSKGADANLGRPLIAALHRDLSVSRQLYFVSNLIGHGADVNRLYYLFGDKDNSFSALDWVKQDDVRELLLMNGALPSRIIKERMQDGESVKPIAYSDAAKTASEALKKDSLTTAEMDKRVIQFFQAKFGPVDARSIVGTAQEDHHIEIHVVRPTENCACLTLFTTGMSSKPLPIKQGVKSSRFAELFVQLPGSWDFSQLKDPSFSWPLKWLKKLAKLPAASGICLPYPFSILPSDKHQPIAPGLEFDSFVLFAEDEIPLPRGEELHLFRLVPLYPEERFVAQKKGPTTLLQQFDRRKLSRIVDTKRKSTVGYDQIF